MKYQILRNTDAEELEKTVNRVIGQGWQPHGGVSIGIGKENEIIYAQAVVNFS